MEVIQKLDDGDMPVKETARPIHLEYDRAFVNERSLYELAFFLVHEGEHVRRMTYRMAVKQGRWWNAAQDHEINLALEREGWTVPGGALLDRRFTGMTAEEILPILVAEDNAGASRFRPREAEN